MGSPLVPAQAGIFINCLIDEFQKKTNISITIYCSVDDQLLAFDNQIEIDIICNLFNSIHKKIIFTKALEKNNHLPFWMLILGKLKTILKLLFSRNKLTQDYKQNRTAIFYTNINKT